MADRSEPTTKDTIAIIILFLAVIAACVYVGCPPISTQTQAYEDMDQ